MEQGWPEVIFEFDCQSLVSFVNSSSVQWSWEIETIVDDIKNWALSKRWFFVWCPRGLNRAAYWVAS
ncbi:hypothetical protein RHMOL_Rhmol07G0316600 [Rhododendron molle]|uniref:Uncharacterized protein n=1 Tax=Rhododendron molle TaxID=49168 RepID=A0ACC0N823_RHOML|nr:hypothetical protein RHMOL_Rhmol07G0316600 [Rhododendron molle]